MTGIRSNLRSQRLCGDSDCIPACPGMSGVQTKPVVVAAHQRPRAESSSCPAKRGRGTTLRSRVVEGASAVRSSEPPEWRRVCTPPPPPCGRSPSPAAFHSAGADKHNRSRGASAPEFLFVCSPTRGGGAPTGAPAMCRTSGRGSASGGTRSPLGAPPRLLLRRPNATAQPRAALPGITGCERVSPLPGPAQRAPRGPVVVPAGRGPEAARERDCETRPQAPHSLRNRRSHPDAPVDERDWALVTEIVTNVKRRCCGDDRLCSRASPRTKIASTTN